MENSLNLLSRRAGFNTALRHFKTVNNFVTEMNEGENLADIINASLADGTIERYQVKSILNALLADKFEYAYRSHNLTETIENGDKIVEKLNPWGKLHIVIAYHDPQAGLLVLNPKSAAQWEETLPLTKEEMMVVYVGTVRGNTDEKILQSAIDDFLKVLYGKTVKDKKEYLGPPRPVRSVRPEPETAAPAQPQQAAEPGEAAPAARAEAAPSPAPSGGGKRRMTPRYAVVVTNELFHNGNVEAWKKIIESYRSKYEGTDVLVWYENERINDINALFKWGKVKHGTPIMFSVAGENIKDVSKLQRYLFEGASPRFEVFLRGGVDRVLDLF